MCIHTARYVDICHFAYSIKWWANPKIKKLAYLAGKCSGDTRDSGIMRRISANYVQCFSGLCATVFQLMCVLYGLNILLSLSRSLKVV